MARRHLWFLERNDSRINFVQGLPFVKQNVFTSLDPKPAGRGRSGARRAREKGGVRPSLWAARTGRRLPSARWMIYIPANENLCSDAIGAPISYKPGERFTGTTTGFYIAPGADHIGEVQAWNVDTGKRAWTHQYKTSQNWGPMLATAGGLVFSGGTNDQRFHAFDASSGKLVWEFPTSSGIIGQPSSFMVNGSSTSRFSPMGSTREGCRRAQ